MKNYVSLADIANQFPKWDAFISRTCEDKHDSCEEDCRYVSLWQTEVDYLDNYRNNDDECRKDTVQNCLKG